MATAKTFGVLGWITGYRSTPQSWTAPFDMRVAWVKPHNFDVVHIGERPLSPVVAVAGNQKLRAQAAKLALCCRIAFEQDFLMVDPSAPVLRNDSPLGLELGISIVRFMPSTGLPTTAQPADVLSIDNGAGPELENSGVWADPAEPSQKQSRSNKIQR